MNGTGGERVGAMVNPPHLGELIRESMDEVGWNVTETAAHLGCERGTLSRLLNGKAGVSANMALALEALGWGTAEHWMRMQASYELAQARMAGGHSGARCGPAVSAILDQVANRCIPAFFIDSLTRSGMSGSPVFARYHGTWDMGDPYRKVDPDEPGFWKRDDIVCLAVDPRPDALGSVLRMELSR